MQSKDDRIEELLILLKKEKKYVSGARLGEILGISRAGVWKLIKELKARGYRIESKPKKGYLFLDFPENLDLYGIKEGLKTKVLGKRLHLLQEVDSTNTWAIKEALKGAEEGEVFLAEAQTQGKGRMGRKWFSPKGKNIYLSLILKPQMPPQRVPLLNLGASLALAYVLEKLGLEPELKWPNDVLLRGKKVCGILSEAYAEADKVNFVVLGIGLNVNTKKEDFPEELRDSATSLLIETGKEFSRNHLVKEILQELEGVYFLLKENPGEVLSKWCSYAKVEGKMVEVESFGELIEGVAEGIDEEGALLVKTERGIKRVVAGDVKVKGWKGS
jgi:BirA family biotin operon repressor/biotin-[acetyl-CoA-carboxylase] ligase